MKKLPLILVLIFLVHAAHAQMSYKMLADSIYITNGSKPAELNLENSTKSVKGFLYNKGNGRTEFRKAMKLNDSTLLFGDDSLVMRGAAVADNGLSKVGGNIQLGQPAGTAGDPAALTGNREIPMGGFDFRFRDVGKGNAGIIKIIADSAKARNLEQIDFLTTKGDTAGVINLSPQHDVFIGYRAGGTQNAAYQPNTFIGDQAGSSVTTGYSNTGVGGASLPRLTTGNSNIAFGGLNGVTTGSNNIGVGFTSGAGITTGSNNVAIGGGAGPNSPLQNNQTGSNNIGIGNGALGESQMGKAGSSNSSNNIAIGISCMQFKAHGNNNVGLGYWCGVGSWFGNSNISIGSNMYTRETTVGDSNVVLGSGITNTSFGNNNILLGSNINVTGNISNSVVIGKGIINSASNVIRLGRNDQHVIIGSTADIADNGNRVQINGTTSISDTLKLQNLVAKSASTDYSPLMADANGNVFKSDNALPAARQSFAQTNTVTISGVDEDATLIGSGAGSLTIPAAAWYVGKTYRIIVKGFYSTDPDNPAGIGFKIILGSTVIAQTTGTWLGANHTDIPFDVQVEVTCRSTGSAGSVIAMGAFNSGDQHLNNINNGPAAATVDLSGNQTLDIKARLSDGSAGNKISAFIVLLEAVN